MNKYMFMCFLYFVDVPFVILRVSWGYEIWMLVYQSKHKKA